jgi:hypothetical protein
MAGFYFMRGFCNYLSLLIFAIPHIVAFGDFKLGQCHSFRMMLCNVISFDM